MPKALKSCPKSNKSPNLVTLNLCHTIINFFDLWMTLISTFSVPSSVTRLGDLLHFGQLFKASSNNYFAKIAHIFGNFCIGVKIFQFSSEIIIGQLLETLGNFLLVTLFPSCLTFSLQRTLMKLILVFHSWSQQHIFKLLSELNSKIS